MKSKEGDSYSQRGFGSRLHEYFEKRDIINNHIAVKCGFDPTHVRQILEENKDIRISTLSKFLKAYPDIDLKYCILGVTTHELNEPDEKYAKESSTLLKENVELLRENRELRKKLDECLMKLPPPKPEKPKKQSHVLVK